MRVEYLCAFCKGAGTEVSVLKKTEQYPLVTHFSSISHLETGLSTRQEVERTVTVALLDTVDNALEHIRQAVEQGLRAGETDQDIGARLDQLETGLARAQADTWARTETTRYYTLGRVQSIEAADDVWGYEYVVIVDNRTTDICRAFVGKRVSKERMTKFPPFHYNCRTTVAAVFFDEAPDLEDELGEEAQPAEGFGADVREVFEELGAPHLPDRLARRLPEAVLDRMVSLPASHTQTSLPYQPPSYEAPEPLLPTAAQRIRYAEAEISDEPVEWSIAFDRAGNERGERQRGWRRGVDLPAGNLAGFVATHNHPDANSFSHKDLYQSMRRGLYEFRAEDGPNTSPPDTPRYQYRVQPGQEGWPLMSLEQYATVYRAAHAQIEHWILTVEDDDLAMSLLSNQSHAVMELLADRLRLRYSRELL